jgi:hypothetical protein
MPADVCPNTKMTALTGVEAPAGTPPHPPGLTNQLRLCCHWLLLLQHRQHNIDSSDNIDSPDLLVASAWRCCRISFELNESVLTHVCTPLAPAHKQSPPVTTAARHV